MMFEVTRTAVGAEVESLAGIQCQMPSFPNETVGLEIESFVQHSATR